VSERPIHDRLEELFAVDAMDGLDDDGRRELHELLTWHDSQCPECARFRREFAEVSTAMAMSLDPLPLSVGAEERLLTATRTSGQGRPVRSVPTSGDVVELDDVREERERMRGPAKVAVALLTGAACLVGAGVVGYVIRSPSTSTSPEPVVAAYSAQGTTQHATMQDGSKKLTVYYHPGERPAPALLVGSGMDDPPSGHVYELWYLPQGQTAMAPGGTFTPNDGEVIAPALVETPFTTLAVSIETGYQTAPQGEVVLSVKVSP
jgi:anti-sigma-K factor RskA